METTEKIYYCDRGDNDNTLAAAILAGNNRKDDWSPIEEKRLAEQYGMHYGEEVGDAQE